jgi:hypothetical protein
MSAADQSARAARVITSRVRRGKPDKPFVVDPDSPFAALAALKFRK